LLYAIHAIIRVSNHAESTERTVQMPTFFLDSNIQGIMNADHAEEIARSMFARLGIEGDNVSVSAFVHASAIDRF